MKASRKMSTLISVPTVSSYRGLLECLALGRTYLTTKYRQGRKNTRNGSGWNEESSRRFWRARFDCECSTGDIRRGALLPRPAGFKIIHGCGLRMLLNTEFLSAPFLYDSHLGTNLQTKNVNSKKAFQIADRVVL
jgi:hypothetical protein